ncbi:hypothetical protein [Roseicella aquatilis]|uniref:Uncharacterized protein n=1 Tax=Roseicella aquatilis TaxID=2527868 RepID=A0A4R4DW80_9PROT|nr:hypothetical protein [Roseicella aquatilis]TCZ66628.1 hypothetical protein EXY23_00490 [Roseicella aquatilis]
MDGTDLRRRMDWARDAARAAARIARLERRQPELPPVTAADCLKLGRDPMQRIALLGRGAQAPRQNAAAGQVSSNSIPGSPFAMARR